MKSVIGFLVLSWLVIMMAACNPKDPLPSDDAKLHSIQLEVEGVIYNTSIAGSRITLTDDLPFGTNYVTVSLLTISANATCSIAEGEQLPVTEEGIDIIITAEDTVTTRIYHLDYTVAGPSDQASLVLMVVSYNENQYPVVFNGYDITVDEEFAYNATGNIKIISFMISDFATSNIFHGQQFSVDSCLTIVVTAQDSINRSTYSFSIIKDTEGALLTGNPDYTSCEKYNTYRFDELMMENNMWNVNNLPPGSFSQCIYHYEEGITTLFGWEWSFGEDQYGVNAYPEVIFGVKPWYAWQGSTTIHIPKKVGDITSCKVDYDAECFVNDGEYNLAFDNWICHTSTVSPENIRFEFMIWEDSKGLTPFGDLYGQVETTNGTYKLYKGEPDWEPAGCNWTYLAFVKEEKRQSGV
ncbi:MAG: hypothetical protein RBS55_01830, partial [Bacteroidales bacterium]|nr:hypothetical protein [Bacteroidales bacterium]